MFIPEGLEARINAVYLKCLINGKCQLNQAHLKHALPYDADGKEIGRTKYEYDVNGRVVKIDFGNPLAYEKKEHGVIA